MSNPNDYHGYYQTQKRMQDQQAAHLAKNLAQNNARMAKAARQASSASSSGGVSFGSTSSGGNSTTASSRESFDWESFFEGVWELSAWAFDWFDEWASSDGKDIVMGILTLCAIISAITSLFFISFSWVGLATVVACGVGGFAALPIIYVGLRLALSVLTVVVILGAGAGFLFGIGWTVFWFMDWL